jgi:two-component system, OmpR family, sensor histidine kinase KdpD
MSCEIHRKTPDEILREALTEETDVRGRLKIFLGYASGVGKSFRMLDEARRRLERGQDVVVGAVQPKVSPEIQKLCGKLEIIPLKKFPNGSAMDVETILKRRPAVCVIDGLAFNNPTGLRNATRWQDARELVNAGIKVIGSINIQYVEELREQVEALTGKHVTETVPTSFITSADEIEIVDAPDEETIERSFDQLTGDEKRQQQLAVLREMTLVLAADVVDHQLCDYLDKHGIQQNYGTQERILVGITPRANANEMIETARRIAERFHGELIVAYVKQADLSPADNTALEERLVTARSAGARVEVLEGEDPVDALIDFAKSHQITQLFVGHSQRQRRWLWSDPVNRLIRKSQGIDLRIFPQS